RDALEAGEAVPVGSRVVRVLPLRRWPQVVPLVVQAVMVDVIGAFPAGDQLVHPDGCPLAVTPDRCRRIRACWTPSRWLSLHDVPPVLHHEVVVPVVHTYDPARALFPAQGYGLHVGPPWQRGKGLAAAAGVSSACRSPVSGTNILLQNPL